MKRILAWFGTVFGKVVGIFLVVLIIFLIWKWQWVYDRARGAWWGLNNAQGDVHIANADTALVRARQDSVNAASLTRELEAILSEPTILSNPGAVRVGVSSKKVIAAKDSEIGNLKTAVTESKSAAASYKAAGEKPVPRFSPYGDLGYTISLTKKYGVPTVRAGATYRVIGWAHVKGELSYEPPPTISQKRMDALEAINERDLMKPEIRATVSAHFKF